MSRNYHLNKNTYYMNTTKWFNEREEDPSDHRYIESNTSANTKSSQIRGILSCIGGVLIYLSLGSIYTFGNMLPYIASYLSTTNSDHNYLEYVSKTNYIFACTICGQSVVFPIGSVFFSALNISYTNCIQQTKGGKLGEKFGTKLTIAIGCIIHSIFGVLCTYFICDNLYLIYLTYGVLFGVGIGIAYPNILVIVMSFYPNNKGLVNGIVLCGFGISALIFDKVQTVLINPSNIKQDALNGFDEGEIIKVFPFVFVYLGICFFVMQMFGVCLLSNAPPRTEQQRDIEDEDERETLMPIAGVSLYQQTPSVIEYDGADDETDGYDLVDIVKDIRFWQLYFNFFVDGLVIVFVATQWKIFSNKLGSMCFHLSCHCPKIHS